MVSHVGSNDGRLDLVSVGSLIGDRYRIEALIDEGAMGRVFLGEHVHMKKRVAIKVLRPELTRVPEVLQRFEREAMAAAHIEHQNVASARDFGKLPDGSVYLVLEYVEGTTLRKELRRGRFEAPRALRIARQIALALGAAHDLDIVHRDLKPENVMLLDRGATRDFVKVLDFGVAKVPVDISQQDPTRPTGERIKRDDDSLVTKAGMVFGTPDYMSPEQALGQPVDARADLYSLGIMLYEMLAGVRPFRADQELGILGQQLSVGPPPFSKRVPDLHVDEAIEKTVFSLLAREPSQRPNRAARVVQLIDAHLVALGEAPEPSMRDRFPSTRDSFPSRDSLLGRDSGELSTLAQPSRTLDQTGSQALSERVKSALPKPLQSIPTWGVLLMPITLLAGFAFVVVQFGGRDQTTTKVVPDATQTTRTALVTPSAPPESKTANVLPPLTDEQVEAAVEAGDLAVAALAERYPNDARAHLGEARVAKKTGDAKATLAALGRALELDANMRHNAHAATLLWWSVQKPETQTQALALLKGPMKAQGADILYDLAINERIKKPLSDNARAWLGTKKFERESTPAAAAAAALLLAKTCEVRKALIKRAENVGDARAAKLLTQFRAGKGCAPNEASPCNVCLPAKEVQAALGAILARQKSAAAAPSSTR
jgi:eukaryotic-like serine/threonine-protein kinase